MSSAHLVSSTLPPADLVAAKLHDAEMIANKNAGKFSVKLPGGEETMVPYDQLSDAAKGEIRGSVERVYNAIDDASEQPKTRRAG